MKKAVWVIPVGIGLLVIFWDAIKKNFEKIRGIIRANI